uniref:Uncharacterized protein n=1 Tax=Strombidium inclinatum TaxID=197538 RepID=A0A7S3N2Q1_9SPIT|mmetsp:Transcript_4544/g.6863  ORF Transcript_4544/g.6863 Transcript_4544/m.6863 type:complete len:149 (+) Transcript_4544:317-763(+)
MDRNNVASVYIRGGKIYEFDGEQSVSGLLEYFSEDNFKKSNALVEDLEDFVNQVLGKKVTLSQRIYKTFMDVNNEIEKKMKAWTKKIPYVDRWHPSAKLVMFYTFVMPPLFFGLAFLILHIQIFFHNRGVDKKYAELNRKMKQAKKEK